MKYYELDKYEKEILHAFDNDEFVSVANKKDIENYRKYAKNTLNKVKNINIRLSERDLRRLKAKAVKKGLPYQTLLASLIHQYADDQINCV
jgi:predicted DNA binding CopG/RHH family protein